MKTKKLSNLLAITCLVGLAGLTGCASPGLGSGNYRQTEVRVEQSVRYGNVEAVRDVRIDHQSSGVGTLGGAAIGGIAGSKIGGGSRAHAAGAIAGAILGGVVGGAIEKSGNDIQGVEVIVRLQSGQVISIVQAKDEDFRPGDRVRVLNGQGNARVSRY